MEASKEPDNLTFMDLFRKEIMDCVTEAVSKAVPKASPTDSMPLTLTVPQFCKQMNVSKSVAFEMINSKGFPVFRVGTKYLISTKGLQEWIDRQCEWRKCG